MAAQQVVQHELVQALRRADHAVDVHVHEALRELLDRLAELAAARECGERGGDRRDALRARRERGVAGREQLAELAAVAAKLVAEGALQRRVHADLGAERVAHVGGERQLRGEIEPEIVEHAIDADEREVERYGGAEGIVLAERLFCADSAAALAILDACRGDAGAEHAWRLALVGIDRLLDDLGLDLAAKLRLATHTRDALGAEVGMDTALQRALGDKFRRHRGELARLLETGHPALAARSRRLAPIAGMLDALSRGGKLAQPIEQLAQSYVHMHVNRVVRTSQRLHELVLHDLLRRHYDGLVARAKKQSA